MDLEEGSYPETAEPRHLEPSIKLPEDQLIRLLPPCSFLLLLILESSLFEQLSSFSARLHPLKVIPPLL
ncbi:hypothetical protein BHE90_008002 [Fusarium euwallaceae]|uniref:Uncharacterized protein n=2 Tax=Fusarium solani species complex TaxID=232080 RepID=A0A430LPB6_9HYPO|nr:hypothetical protein CEP51_007037 [Fusarium floridanum]RTE77541.1 hypothetical protein BHE90_008002 [Fusarium euwallaceae]